MRVANSILFTLIYLDGRHDWIRTSDLFRVKNVKLRHFNLQDPGGSLSPCKYTKHRETTYRKTYHCCDAHRRHTREAVR